MSPISGPIPHRLRHELVLLPCSLVEEGMLVSREILVRILPARPTGPQPGSSAEGDDEPRQPRHGEYLQG